MTIKFHGKDLIRTKTIVENKTIEAANCIGYNSNINSNYGVN